MSLKICHIIVPLVMWALKLTAINKRINCAHFLNLRNQQSHLKLEELISPSKQTLGTNNVIWSIKYLQIFSVHELSYNSFNYVLPMREILYRNSCYFLNL